MLLQAILFGIVLLTAWEYAGWFEPRADKIIFGYDVRPFVYRMLIPLIAWALKALGLTSLLAIQLTITGSAVGLLFSTKYLLDTFFGDRLRNFILAALSTVLFMLLFFWPAMPYDLATASFFAFSIGLLARRKMLAYFLLFPLACFNRETTLLLVFVYSVHFLWDDYKSLIPGLVYQIFIWTLVRAILIQVWEDAPGNGFSFNFMHNLELYWQYPWASLFHWAIIGLVFWLCLRDLTNKPPILQDTFLIWAPLMLVAYMLIGWSFEVRFFAELYPIVVAMLVGDRNG